MIRWGEAAPNPKMGPNKTPVKLYIYIPRTQMTPIFEVEISPEIVKPPCCCGYHLALAVADTTSLIENSEEPHSKQNRLICKILEPKPMDSFSAEIHPFEARAMSKDGRVRFDLLEMV